jgi:hypothetical protein
MATLPPVRRSRRTRLWELERQTVVVTGNVYEGRIERLMPCKALVNIGLPKTMDHLRLTEAEGQRFKIGAQVTVLVVSTRRRIILALHSDRSSMRSRPVSRSSSTTTKPSETVLLAVMVPYGIAGSGHVGHWNTCDQKR